MKISNNKILITGGGSGIGLGLTERFIKENNTVIVCGRRESILKELSVKYPSVITRSCDLSNAVEREDLFRWISETHSDLNVLVNNAGIGINTPFAENTEEQFDTLMNIHFKGAVQGVGFRPFIYRLASRYNLTGWVKNSPQGAERFYRVIVP